MEVATCLRGKISGYNVRRGSASFVFSKKEQGALGMAAIAAGLIGSSGVAIGAAGGSETTEDADQVEFSVEGKMVRGWLWRSPFKDGDEVEVIGDWTDGFCDLRAVVRPSDRVIALYPHLSRGRWAHIFNSVKWWFFGTSVALLFCALFFGVVGLISGANLSRNLFSGFGIAFCVVYLLMLLPTVHLTLRYMKFVTVAEGVFSSLNWKGVRYIDLVKSSKVNRRPDDPDELGTYFFKY